jgi:hypothetical protein
MAGVAKGRGNQQVWSGDSVTSSNRPICGLTAEAMCVRQSVIVVSLTGLDETLTHRARPPYLARG